MKGLAGVAGNQVQCPGGHPDMGPDEGGDGWSRYARDSESNVLLLHMRVGVEEFCFNSQPTFRAGEDSKFGAINRRTSQLQVRQRDPRQCSGTSDVLQSFRDRESSIEAYVGMELVCRRSLPHR